MRARLRHFDPILIQAIIAAALSFAHIHDIAAAAGQGGWKAWAYPISVDLLLVAAWRRLRNVGGVAGWVWFLVAVGASLSANVMTSGMLDMQHLPVALRVIVAGWPAVAFLGGTLLVHSKRAANARHNEDVADTDVDVERETPTQTTPAPPVEPVVPTTTLVTYAEAADALGVDPATIRGWAFGGKVKKHPGPTTNSVLVDLLECKSIQSSRRPVGA